jgi:hypothetical protein
MDTLPGLVTHHMDTRYYSSYSKYGTTYCPLSTSLPYLGTIYNPYSHSPVPSSAFPAPAAGLLHS